MKYQDLTPEDWDFLEDPDYKSGGFPSIVLTANGNDKAILHLFRDKAGNFHFAIEVPTLQPNDVDDPGVNGLQVNVAEYRFHEGSVAKFIDLTCSIKGFIKEFTEIVREISKAILDERVHPLNAVKHSIASWISFWAYKRESVLSEEEQIGLICELLFFERLCPLNLDLALDSWKGPKGETHDFSFTNWGIEVKGTRKKGHVHTINGIGQLVPSTGKSLGFVSFVVTSGILENSNSLNLPSLIERIATDWFGGRPALLVNFHELLARIGYSPLHVDLYQSFNIEVHSSTFFEVDDTFPKLTQSMLVKPLNTRISKIRYDISLEGFSGLDFRKMALDSLIL